jgi:hypothetical protein
VQQIMRRDPRECILNIDEAKWKAVPAGLLT